MDDKHFKNVFKLGDNIMVSQSVIDTYQKYLEGSILLFKHLFDNINSSEFSIQSNENKTRILEIWFEVISNFKKDL